MENVIQTSIRMKQITCGGEGHSNFKKCFKKYSGEDQNKVIQISLKNLLQGRLYGRMSFKNSYNIIVEKVIGSSKHSLKIRVI